MAFYGMSNTLERLEMFNLTRKRGTLTVETVLQAPILPPTSWVPQELSETFPEPFRDPWADDPDRTTRRETFNQ